jgi:biotin operon repressor
MSNLNPHVWTGIAQLHGLELEGLELEALKETGYLIYKLLNLLKLYLA